MRRRSEAEDSGGERGGKVRRNFVSLSLIITAYECKEYSAYMLIRPDADDLKLAYLRCVCARFKAIAPYLHMSRVL